MKNMSNINDLGGVTLKKHSNTNNY